MPRLKTTLPRRPRGPAVAPDARPDGSAEFADALAGLRVTAASQHPDAALLAACDHFDRVDTVVTAQNRACGLDNEPTAGRRHAVAWADIERAGEAWNKAVDALCAIPATTLQGVQAKAEATRRILLRETCLRFDLTDDEEVDDDFAEHADRKDFMCLSLLDDLAKVRS